MSYCFDILMKVYTHHIKPHVPDDELRERFEFLLEELHEANHRLNDAVNKDSRVTRTATKLNEYVDKMRPSIPGEQV